MDKFWWFVANWSINIDPLSSVMLVVVTFVSALVHIYSIGYMSHDPHKPRFMSYLSLFTFSMLALVVSDNFLQLFFGWEGVGLCSYLLIGFWYKKETANNAAIKAFIVNRIGDFGLALAIFLIFFLFLAQLILMRFSSHKPILRKKIIFFGFEYKFNNFNLHIPYLLEQWENLPNFYFIHGYPMQWKVQRLFQL